MTLRVCAACTAAYAVGASCCPQCGSADRAEDRVTMLPTIRVACAWDGCRYEDVDRTVRLRPVGIGLVEMPTLLCAGCGRIPLVTSHWSPIPEEEEDDVPKITVHGGPSNADDETPGEHVPEPASLPEREYLPGEPLPPIPDSAHDADATPLPEATDAAPRPSLNAPKADWTAYQIGRGLDADEAAGMTKSALQAWEPAVESTGTTGLQVTAEAEVTRDGERAS